MKQNRLTEVLVNRMIDVLEWCHGKGIRLGRYNPLG